MHTEEGTRAGETAKQYLQRCCRQAAAYGARQAALNLKAIKAWERAVRRAGLKSKRDWWNVLAARKYKVRDGLVTLRVGRRRFYIAAMREACIRQGVKPKTEVIVSTGVLPQSHRTPQKRWNDRLRAP